MAMRQAERAGRMTLYTATKNLESPIEGWDGTPSATSTAAHAGRLESVRFRVGIAQVCASTIFFSLASVFVKLDTAPSGLPFPTLEIALLRAVLSVVVALALAKFVCGVSFLPDVDLFTNIVTVVRGFFDFTASNCFYYACATLPISIATLIHFSNPFWAGVLGRLLLGEAYGPRDLALGLVAFSGVALAVWPELAGRGPARAPLPTLGLVAAVHGSIFQALQYVTGRMVTKSGVHWVQANGAYGLVGTTVGLAAIFAFCPRGLSDQCFVPPGLWTTREALATCSIVSCALVAQAMLIMGMGTIPAVLSATLRLLDIPLAIVWSILLLNAWPTGHQLVGALVLMGSCLGLARRRHAALAGPGRQAGEPGTQLAEAAGTAVGRPVSPPGSPAAEPATQRRRSPTL